ncbi:hypothetical protein [Mucilaginibacter sp.]|jgi:hypothetical protein|uniref:hypothetical protein n=1 Tax=Mucilaginibacter sp. TaxID=1882438 RepID=UPI0035624DA1
MILTTLKDYAKQKGITRARAYQLQNKLPLIDLPVYAIAEDGTRIPLYKDGEPLLQTYVQQDRATVQAEYDMLKVQLSSCNTHEARRIVDRARAIETILK